MSTKIIATNPSCGIKVSEKIKIQKNLPDQIVDFFLSLIFIGELKPGDRLPSEIRLTKILKVNQSSLRMAIRVLTRINVIKSTRGSGLIVLDYRFESGPNFYSELSKISELRLGSEFLLSALDQMPELLGLLMKSVTQHLNNKTSLAYITGLDAQIEYIEAGRLPSDIAEIDIRLQEDASKKLGNPLLRSIFNSFSPIRSLLMEIYYSHHTSSIEHIKAQRSNWISLIKEEISKDEFSQRYLELIREEANELKGYLGKLQPKPQLLASPLKHYPELISLSQT